MADDCPACPAGAPMWIVTFSDLMSLLLVLFVLLLTFAEMNVIKYKALAGSMRDAFGATREDRLSGMIELDGSILRKKAAQVDPTRSPIPYVSVDIPGVPDDFKAPTTETEKGPTEAEILAAEIKEALAEEIADDGMSVEQRGEEVIIRFPSSIAFSSGSDNITTAFAETLAKLDAALVETEGQIIVSGHTDNVPISGGKFRSNWDLSAARATSVVHQVLDLGTTEASRMTVQGYGDSRPLAPNDTAANRALNRRVEITIVTRKEARAPRN